MNWISIAFWLLFGLLLTGLWTFPQHEMIVGILALILGVVQLAQTLQR